MKELVIKGGTSAKLGRIEGDLRIGKNVKISSESGEAVVLTGTVTLEGRTTIESSLECQSMVLRGRGWGPEGDVVVDGDLTVHGVTDLDGSLSVSGTINAGDMDIAGHLKSGPLVSKRLRVGGHLETMGRLESGDADIAGHMTVRDEVTLKNLRAGGHVKIGGGVIQGEVRVRGHLTTDSPLKFGKMQVYGHTVLPAGSSGGSLSALGKVEFEGDADCRTLEITGSARVRGDCRADEVEVKGNLGVAGRTTVASKIRVFGAASLRGTLHCGALGVSGRLETEAASAADLADIVGEVNTSRGTKAKSIVVGKGSVVTGPLVGDKVEIGKEMDFGSAWGLPWWRANFGRTTSVGDVYGKNVRIGANSRAKRVYAETVELEEGGIAYEVVYAKEVKLPKKYFLAREPRKTESLPAPPL